MEKIYTIELYHHGVKGMKWGVRRYREKRDERRLRRSKQKIADIKTRAHKNNWSEDAKRSRIMRAKNLTQLSNADLKKLNERIRLEKEYANLTAKQKSAGQKFVESVLTDSAKKTATNYASKFMSIGIDYAGNKIVDFIGDQVVKDIKF